MARFRTIDPALRASPLLDGMSAADVVTLMFIVSEVDDEGRMLADEIALERSLFPRRLPGGMNVDGILSTVRILEERGIVVTYVVKGQRYLAVTGWRDGESCFYQNIGRRVPSRLPAPPAGAVRVLPRRQVGATSDELNESSMSPQVPILDHATRTHEGRDVDADEDAKRRDEDATVKPSSVGAAVAEAATPPLRGSELYEALRKFERTIPPLPDHAKKTVSVALDALQSRTEAGEQLARLALAQVEEIAGRMRRIQEGCADLAKRMKAGAK